MSDNPFDQLGVDLHSALPSGVAQHPANDPSTVFGAPAAPHHQAAMNMMPQAVMGAPPAQPPLPYGNQSMFGEDTTSPQPNYGQSPYNMAAPAPVTPAYDHPAPTAAFDNPFGDQGGHEVATGGFPSSDSSSGPYSSVGHQAANPYDMARAPGPTMPSLGAPGASQDFSAGNSLGGSMPDGLPPQPPSDNVYDDPWNASQSHTGVQSGPPPPGLATDPWGGGTLALPQLNMPVPSQLPTTQASYGTSVPAPYGGASVDMYGSHSQQQDAPAAYGNPHPNLGAIVPAQQQSNPYAQQINPHDNPYMQPVPYGMPYGQPAPPPPAPVDPFSVFEKAPEPTSFAPPMSEALVVAAPAPAVPVADDEFWGGFAAQAPTQIDPDGGGIKEQSNPKDNDTSSEEKKGDEGLPPGGEWYDARIFTPTLGVMFFKPQELTDSLFLNTDRAIVDALGERPVVAFIVEGSSARSAGVELGHVLLKVNGVDVKNPKDASRLIKEGPRPLPLLFYVPNTEVVVAEGEHMVKYDTRDTTAPNSAKDWKPKYVVIGGIIAQPWMMNMYRSKSEYDIAVIETQARRPVSVKVKQFSLQGARIQNDWQGPQMVKYKNKLHPWKFIVVLPVARNPIKISSPNLTQLKPLHEGIRRVLLAQQRNRGGAPAREREGERNRDSYSQSPPPRSPRRDSQASPPSRASQKANARSTESRSTEQTEQNSRPSESNARPSQSITTEVDLLGQQNTQQLPPQQPPRLEFQQPQPQFNPSQPPPQFNPSQPPPPLAIQYDPSQYQHPQYQQQPQYHQQQQEAQYQLHPPQYQQPHLQNQFLQPQLQEPQYQQTQPYMNGGGGGDQYGLSQQQQHQHQPPPSYSADPYGGGFGGQGLSAPQNQLTYAPTQNYHY